MPVVLILSLFAVVFAGVIAVLPPIPRTRSGFNRTFSNPLRDSITVKCHPNDWKIGATLTGTVVGFCPGFNVFNKIRWDWGSGGSIISPIHKGSARSKNFTVNARKNAFRCFSRDCGSSGNVLDFVAAIERCSVRDAALKLNEWFKVGESAESAKQQDERANSTGKIQRGIYRDKDGALYELVAVATSTEDSKPLVVYRELFGDYSFWIAPTHAFCAVKGSEQPRFSLVKEF